VKCQLRFIRGIETATHFEVDWGAIEDNLIVGGGESSLGRRGREEKKASYDA
jgi:hypothetical protein